MCEPVQVGSILWFIDDQCGGRSAVVDLTSKQFLEQHVKPYLDSTKCAQSLAFALNRQQGVNVPTGSVKTPFVSYASHVKILSILDGLARDLGEDSWVWFDALCAAGLSNSSDESCHGFFDHLSASGSMALVCDLGSTSCNDWARAAFVAPTALREAYAATITRIPIQIVFTPDADLVVAREPWRLSSDLLSSDVWSGVQSFDAISTRVNLPSSLKDFNVVATYTLKKELFKSLVQRWPSLHSAQTQFPMIAIYQRACKTCTPPLPCTNQHDYHSLSLHNAFDSLLDSVSLCQRSKEFERVCVWWILLLYALELTVRLSILSVGITPTALALITTTSLILLPPLAASLCTQQCFAAWQRSLASQQQTLNEAMTRAISVSWTLDLLRALAASDEAAAAAIIRACQCLNLNMVNAARETPLLCAVRNNVSPALIRTLLRRGAEVNATCLARSTALHWAVQGRRVGVVKMLLEAGADVDAQDVKGRTPLVVLLGGEGASVLSDAEEEGEEEEERGKGGIRVGAAQAESEKGPGEVAMGQGRGRSILRELLRAGASVNAHDSGGRGALHHAVLSDDPAAVGAVIAAGARADASDLDGRTPLIAGLRALVLAEREGGETEGWTDQETTGGTTRVHGEESGVVQMLIAAGVGVKCRDEGDGSSALHLAVLAGDLDVASLLVSAGADLDAVDFDQRTPLIVAARALWLEAFAHAKRRRQHDPDVGCLQTSTQSAVPAAGVFGDVLQLLVGAGAGVDASDATGRTALHFAAAANNPHAVRCLLARKASVNRPDRRGRTPLHAVTASHSVEALVRHVSGEGEEELALALAGCDRRAVRVGAGTTVQAVAALLGANANANAADAYRHTPLHLAAASGVGKSVELLLSAGASVTAQDLNQRTPLHCAAGALGLFPAAAGPGPCVPVQFGVTLDVGAGAGAALVGAGAHVQAVDQFHQPPLWYAARHSAGLASLLLRIGADVDGRTWWEAARRGGAGGYCEGGGLPPVYEALRGGCVGAFAAMVEHGAGLELELASEEPQPATLRDQEPRGPPAAEVNERALALMGRAAVAVRQLEREGRVGAHRLPWWWALVPTRERGGVLEVVWEAEWAGRFKGLLLAKQEVAKAVSRRF